MTWILLLFIINNLIWMVFLFYAVLIVMPERQRKTLVLPKPKFRIKNPLAPKRTEQRLEDVATDAPDPLTVYKSLTKNGVES